MEKLKINPIHYCIFSGILSGIIVSGFITYEGFTSSIREGFDIRFVILSVITNLLLTLLFYCSALGGFGLISGYLLSKRIQFGWKILFLILLSICSGLIGFYSIVPDFRFDKNNIPHFSSIYYTIIFFIAFLFLQIPSYIRLNTKFKKQNE